MAETIEVLVEGGKATPGPPLGPALGPLGVNVIQIVNAINEKTKNFEGMKVPVKVIIDAKTKGFDIKVGTPPTSALVLKEIGVEKGSGAAKTAKAGNITIDQAIKIANMKEDSLLGKTLKKRVLEVIGACVSIGVTVESREPKDVQKDMIAGKFDDKLAK